MPVLSWHNYSGIKRRLRSCTHTRRTPGRLPSRSANLSTFVYIANGFLELSPRFATLINSYHIRTVDGRHFRRNRSAINVRRTTPERLVVPPAPVIGAPSTTQQPPTPSPIPDVALRHSTPPAASPVTPGRPSLVEADSPFNGFPDRPFGPPGPPPSDGTTRTGRPYLAHPRQLL